MPETSEYDDSSLVSMQDAMSHNTDTEHDTHTVTVEDVSISQAQSDFGSDVVSEIAPSNPKESVDMSVQLSMHNSESFLSDGVAMSEVCTLRVCTDHGYARIICQNNPRITHTHE